MARQSKFTASFKAKVAVEALKETEPLESLAKKYGVAPGHCQTSVEKLNG